MIIDYLKFFVGLSALIFMGWIFFVVIDGCREDMRLNNIIYSCEKIGLFIDKNENVISCGKKHE